MAQIVDLDAVRSRRAQRARIAGDITRAVIDALTDGDSSIALDPNFPLIVRDITMERLGALKMFEECA
jgi:hypothetical protein